MLIDYYATVTSETAFDLDTVRPGPGEPITFAIVDADATGDMTVYQGATSTVAEAESNQLMVVAYAAGSTDTFTIPANCLRYIQLEIPTGATVAVVMDAQTNL